MDEGSWCRIRADAGGGPAIVRCSRQENQGMGVLEMKRMSDESGGLTAD